MGFKLKKKNSGEETVRKAVVRFFWQNYRHRQNNFSSVFGETEKSKPLIYGAAFGIILSLFLLLYLFYSVPRNNQLTRSLGELRLLSQTNFTSSN